MTFPWTGQSKIVLVSGARSADRLSACLSARTAGESRASEAPRLLRACLGRPLFLLRAIGPLSLLCRADIGIGPRLGAPRRTNGCPAEPESAYALLREPAWVGGAGLQPT